MTAYPLAGAARYWTRRAFRPRIPLVVLTAVLIGASVAYSSALVFVAAVGVLALTVFIKAPSWMLVVLVVASFAGADVTRLELVANGVPVSAAGVLGLGRLSLALAALALARAVLQQDVPRIPRGVLVAVGTYLVSILLQVQIALIRGTGSPAILSDLQRETAVVAAFVVGVIVVHSAKRRLALYRGLAAVGLVCSLGALWYWGWASEVIGPPPFMGEIFVHARERAIDHGGAVDRARFPFVLTHPNLCGFVLASMAVFATPPLLQSPQLRDRLFALLVAVVTAGGVLGTQSRTALLALAAGAVAYLLLTRAISPRMRALAFAAIALLGIGVWALLDLLTDRRTFTDLSTLESRQAIWSDAVEVIGQSPFIGHGFQVSGFGQFGDGGQSVHNEYLSRLVDGGVVGFALWIWVLMTFVVIALALWRSPGLRSAEGTSLLAFFAVLALTMMTNAPWSNSTSPIFIWLFLGMGTGAYIAPVALTPRGDEDPAPRAPDSG